MEGNNFALAFGLVVAAGACTCLGALLVFCSNLANPKWLSGSLGASAGVMIYVSFVEILSTKAVAAFQDAGHSPAQAQRYACFSFFAGLMATWLLSKAVELVVSAAGAWHKHKEAKAAKAAAGAISLPQHTASTGVSSSDGGASVVDAAINIPDQQQQSAVVVAVAAADAEQGLGAAAAGKGGADVSGRCQAADAQHCKDAELLPAAAAAGPAAAGDAEAAAADSTGACRCCGGSPVAKEETQRDLMAVLSADCHGMDLTRMGLLTGLAVGLHNLPEGVATFAATLASPATGVVIAIAIALHNIPEGVAVALPLYYATGSKWKGLMWATISGAAEPLGGLIGYAVLSSTGMSQLAFGIMFSFIAGMMVYISIRELLPTAIRYDPRDSCATACAFWGMAIMAASLLLFQVNK